MMAKTSKSRKDRAERELAAKQDAKSKKTPMKRNIKVDDVGAFTRGDIVRAHQGLDWTPNQLREAKIRDVSVTTD